MKRARIRKAKALAAASRRAYLCLALGAGFIGVLFAVALSVVPVGLPQEMIKAHVRHESGLRRGLSPESAGAGPLPAAAVTASGDGPAVSPLPGTKTAAKALARPAYLPIGFEQLAAFPFEVTDQMLDATRSAGDASRRTLEQIPEGVKALNERQVSLKGFMLPLSYQGGLTTDFLIMRNQSLCCFGVAPRITDWVNVHVTGKGVKPIMDEPVTVCGTFHVGDVREHGDLVGIYRLEAERLKGPGN